MGKGGLAFLQKKKWHPGTFKNIERTWAAQEENEQMEKQKKLNIVKLKEERYLEELKRLQVQEGLIPKSALDRMPWMYEFGNKVQDSKTAEEFLQGRTITQGDIQGEQEDQQRFKAVVQEEKGNKVCEEFSRLHDDPLFLIRQEEMKQQQQILQNPIQMKNIYEELKEKTKNEKKHKHKHKKHNRSKSRSQSKERKKEKKEKKEKHRQEKRERKALKKEEKQKQNSGLYQDYLKKRLGTNIVGTDPNGKLRLDFNYFKRKLNTSMIAKKQLTQQEQLEMVEQMKERAEQLRKDKLEQYEQDQRKYEKIDKENSKRNPEFLLKTRKEIQKLNEEQDIAETMGRNRNNFISHLDRNENTFKK